MSKSKYNSRLYSRLNIEVEKREDERVETDCKFTVGLDITTNKIYERDK
jgi:hypothetical protein